MPPHLNETVAAGISDVRPPQLEKRVRELEAQLSGENAKREQQVQIMKKLVESKVCNINLHWQKELSSKEKMCEEVKAAAAKDANLLAKMTARMNTLEKQLKEAGVEPKPTKKDYAGEVETRLTSEIERLRGEIDDLKSRLDAKPTFHAGSGASEARVVSLETQNSELKREIESLRKSGDGGNSRGGEVSTSSGDSHRVQELEEQIAALQAAKGKMEKEMASLSTQAAAAGKGASEQAAAAVSAAEKRAEQTEKELAEAKEQAAAAAAAAAKGEKALKKEVEALKQDKENLEQQGSKEVAAMRERIRKAGRKVLSNLQAVREARKAAAGEAKTLQAEMMPVMKQFYQPLKKAVQKMEKENAGWAGKYKLEVQERKRLHNLVLELKGNIRVFCRVRPMLPHEQRMAGDETAQAIFFPEDGRPDLPENKIAVLDTAKGAEKVFEFDHCFGQNSTQEQVFGEVEALVTSVLDGYNVCIFAYGQTGSGKTFTMEGSDSQKGINPRTLERLFDMISERDDTAYSVESAILEIYNEEIKDLVDPSPGKKLEVRTGPDGNYVQDLSQTPVKSYEDVIAIWAKAREQRTVSSNNVNEHSSRSHLVISVYVRGQNRSTGVSSFGKLHLVDLAGSERLSRTGATGDRLKEAQNINKSLSALGDVIAAAASKQGHVPYRNSKLTHVLQDSLGQDSKTLMIVQSSPLSKDAAESMCSLNFASRARSVELGQAKKNTSAGKPAAPPRK